uniref:EF-hand and coiled-coil domain-containing protein 1-like n=1 Tax=Echeneis naucrates TaxID=173247 RepID=A0A665VBM8_ECHNA
SSVCCYTPRLARRTQWIVSTLAYHYGLDRGVENEIIVLATGLDQYLQEIFHHMDYQGEGKIPVEDFNILCEILGLNKDSEGSECVGVSDNLPSELSFRHFHAKLCGYFSTKSGCKYENGRLLVGKDSEHIETQIRLRSPLKRRGKLLGLGDVPPPSAEGRHTFGCRLGSCTKECYEEIVALEEAEDRITKLEDENTSLRELIEDMRAALQSSDARCLALLDYGKATQSINKMKAALLPSTNKLSKKEKNIIHEIEQLQTSRDQQAEEALRCNQRLEQELWSSKETVAALEDYNQALKIEQVGMRRKVEEARQVLLGGLGKVKELEAKASHVPMLQQYILQLESELLCYSWTPLHLSIKQFAVSGIRGQKRQLCLNNYHKVAHGQVEHVCQSHRQLSPVFLVDA